MVTTRPNKTARAEIFQARMRAGRNTSLDNRLCRFGRLDPLVLTITLVAFGLRIWELGSKSLWLDEGISVIFGREPLTRMFAVLAEQDIHPPLYYLALHGWMLVAGESETSIRFVSLISGVLLIPLLFRLTCSLYPGRFGQVTGWLASGLAATSPFLVYYSQEARMYGPLVTAGLAATVALYDVLERPFDRSSPVGENESIVTSRRSHLFNMGSRRELLGWCVYAIVLTIPPYLHYFGWMVIASHGVFIALGIFRYRLRIVPWVVSILVVCTLYAPWLGASVRQLTRLRDTPDFWKSAISLWFVAQHAFAAFSVGFGGALEQYFGVLILFAGAFSVGVTLLAGRAVFRGRPADLLLIAYLVVPLAILLAIVARSPKFADRYLILIVPPFLLLLARGVISFGSLGASLRRRWRVLGSGMIVVAIAAAFGLIAISTREELRVYEDDAYAKDDNRAAVDYLISNWQQGDSVLLMLNFYHVFDYYSHGWLPRYGLSPTDDLEYAASELNVLAAKGHKRMWVLIWNPEWSDPSGSIRTLMDESVERLPTSLEGFRGLQLRLYSLADSPRFASRPAPNQAVDVTFGNVVRLFGIDLDSGATTVSGASKRIALYWDALRPIDEDLNVSLRLLRDGQEWGRFDGRPAAHSYPTMSWRPGRTVRGNLRIDIPDGTPPGKYELRMVVFNAVTRRDLPLRRAGSDPGDTSVVLGAIDIARPAVPPSVPVLPVPTVLPVPPTQNGLTLIGRSLMTEPLDAGATINVALAWRLDGEPANRTTRFELIDSRGKTWVLHSETANADAAYAGLDWRPGEIIVDRRAIAVPADAAPGVARLRVTPSLRSVGAEVSDLTNAIDIGTFDITSRMRTYERPPVRNSVDARFGTIARLVGYDLGPDATSAVVERGKELTLKLYWRAESPTQTSYSVFAHIIDSNERPVAQRDSVPDGGRMPTSGWIVGEFVQDNLKIFVPESVPSGNYRLIVGLYDSLSGARLSVTDGSNQSIDRYVVTQVEVR